MKKASLILQHSTSKSSAVWFSSWLTGTGMEWTDEKSPWLEEMGDGRAEERIATGDGGNATISCLMFMDCTFTFLKFHSLKVCGGFNCSAKVSKIKSKESQCFHSSLKTEDKQMSLLKGNQTRKNFLTWGRVSLFILLRPSTDWTRPTHTRENNLLCSFNRFKC